MWVWVSMDWQPSGVVKSLQNTWKLQISGQQIEMGLLLNVVEYSLLCQGASFCAMPFSKEGRSDSRKWTTDFLHTWTIYNHYIALDMEVLEMFATGVFFGVKQTWSNFDTIIHHCTTCFHLQDSSSFSNQLRDCQQFSQCWARVWCVSGHCRSWAKFATNPRWLEPSLSCWTSDFELLMKRS